MMGEFELMLKSSSKGFFPISAEGFDSFKLCRQSNEGGSKKQVCGECFSVVDKNWIQKTGVFWFLFVSSQRCLYVIGVTSNSPNEKVGSIVRIPNSEFEVQK